MYGVDWISWVFELIEVIPILLVVQKLQMSVYVKQPVELENGIFKLKILIDDL
jgi:hypothetical protein